jgi:hypothetical protein
MNFPIVLKRLLLSMSAGLLLGIAISEMTFYFLNTGETRPPQVVEINIPAGTAEKVALGESSLDLPASMYFVVGDTLKIKNLDSSVHQLGPLFIPAGASASMNLDAEKDYAYTCSFLPGKYLGLNVRPPLTVGTRILGILETGLPLGILIALYSIYAIPLTKQVSDHPERARES